MKTGYPSSFGASATRRDPTTQELSTGLACGPFDKALLDELFYRDSTMYQEMVGFIAASGLTPSDTDLLQLTKGSQSGKINYGVNTGTTNAWAANLSPTPPALAIGMQVRILATATAPTGAVTLNLNGSGAYPVRWGDGSVIAAGDIAAGEVVTLTWTGSYWALPGLSPTQVFALTRRQFVVVQYTGQTLTDADVGRYFQADSSVYNVVTLPNPSTISDGWWIYLESTGTPTGYQTAYCTASGTYQFSLGQYFETTAYLLGGNERFLVWKTGGTYVMMPVTPGSTRELHAVGNVSSSYALSTTKTAGHDMGRQTNGDPTLFSMPATNSWYSNVPVTGRYEIRGQVYLQATGTNAFARVMLMNSLTPTDSNIIALNWFEFATSGGVRTVEVKANRVLRQGTIVALVMDGNVTNEVSARNNLDINFLGR